MRFMRKGFKDKLVGNVISGEMFHKNPFRLMGIPAGVSREDLSYARKKLTNKLNLKPEKAMRGSIVFPDKYQIDPKTAANVLDSLDNPASLLVAEIFWIPLQQNNPFWEEILAKGITTDLDIKKLEEAALDKQDFAAIQTLAVINHIWAISSEYTALETGASSSDPIDHWSEALYWWASLLENRNFEEHLLSRVRDIHHINLKESHVRELVECLPGILLDFNLLFAQHYAISGDLEGFKKHLEIVNKSKFSQADSAEKAASIVQDLINQKLAELNSELKQILSSNSGKFRWDSFTSLIDRMESLNSLLCGEIHVSEDLLQECSFDSIVEPICGALTEKIDNDGKNGVREKKLYMTAVQLNRLGKFPLSKSVENNISSEISKIHSIIWEDEDKVKNGNVQWDKCWFCPGHEVDYSSLLALPYHKVIQKTVTNIKWKTKYLIIPRSELAKKYHEGRISEDQMIAQYADQNKLAALKDNLLRKKSEITASFEQKRVEAEPLFQAANKRIDRAREEHDLRKERLMAEKDLVLDSYKKKSSKAMDELIMAEKQIKNWRAAREKVVNDKNPLVKLFTFVKIKRERAEILQEFKRRVGVAQNLYKNTKNGYDMEKRAEEQELAKAIQAETNKLNEVISANKKDSRVMKKLKIEEEAALNGADLDYRASSRKLAPTVKGKSSESNFPPYQYYLKNGWQKGEKPEQSSVDIEAEIQKLLRRLSVQDAQLLGGAMQSSPEMASAIVMLMLENPRLTVTEALQQIIRKAIS